MVGVGEGARQIGARAVGHGVVGETRGVMRVRAAYVLASRLPPELVRVVTAHRAAMVMQRAARRRMGRRARAAARRRQRDAREQRALRFIASFAFGSVPLGDTFER